MQHERRAYLTYRDENLRDIIKTVRKISPDLYVLGGDEYSVLWGSLKYAPPLWEIVCVVVREPIASLLNLGFEIVRLAKTRGVPHIMYIGCENRTEFESLGIECIDPQPRELEIVKAWILRMLESS